MCVCVCGGGLGACKRTDIWWPWLLLPYLLVLGAPFISHILGYTPGFHEQGEIKAEQYNRAVQHIVLLYVKRVSGSYWASNCRVVDRKLMFQKQVYIHIYVYILYIYTLTTAVSS